MRNAAITTERVNIRFLNKISNNFPHFSESNSFLSGDATVIRGLLWIYTYIRSGSSVKATRKEDKRENTTEKANCLNNWPAIPTTNIIGRKTHTVVRVEPNIAPPTSLVPLTALS